MHAAGHDGDRHAGDRAEEERAGVAFDGGAGEVGDLGIGNGDRGFNLLREGAKAGAEDDADARGRGGEGANVGEGGGGLVEKGQRRHGLVIHSPRRRDAT